MRYRTLLGASLLLVAARAAVADTAVDPASGLKIAPGWEKVRGHCTACHSAKLVTQNHHDRARWQALIRWMQQTQGLWDLGDDEPVVLDYLADQYGIGTETEPMRPRTMPLQ